MKRLQRWKWPTLLVVGVSLLITSYFVFRPDSCDGIAREMGGCDSHRPTYEGLTCEDVAEEIGVELSDRVPNIESVGGRSASVRLLDVETVVFQLANKHMRDAELTPNCDSGVFVASIQSAINGNVCAAAGAMMYEGNPVADCDEWLHRLDEWVALVLDEPSKPYEPETP